MQKTRGLIAAGHEATAKAAAVILEEGGNAFDAAIAALMASFVAEPCMSSAAGGAFLIAHRADGLSLGYDCFVQTPRHKRPLEEVEFFPIDIDFGETVEQFYVGMGSVAIPGIVKGIWEIHEDMGSLPMKVLAEPAIALAKKGVLVDDFQDHDFHLLEPILSLLKPSPVFWQEGRLVSSGETMKMPELADTLDYLVREGPRAFYEGDIAHLLLKQNDRLGGHITAEDLVSYRAPRRHPLSFPFRNRTVQAIPFPGLGGSLVALTLGLLEKTGPVDFPFGSEEMVSRWARVLSQLDRMEKTPPNLASALAQMYPGIQMGSAGTSRHQGGTSHFSILDEFGNAVGVTMTIGEGAGHFIPGTGIVLNNMLGELALLPKGLHNWDPNTRLGSMMSPAIVLDKDGKAEIVLGSGGAGRIPYMLAQVIHQVVDLGMDLSSAVKAPRMHIIDNVCNMEPGLPGNSILPDGVSLRAWKKQSLYFGGVHAVMRGKKGLEAQGDPRRGGAIVGVGI